MMTRILAATAIAALLSGCGPRPASTKCEEPTMIAPPSIGGAAFVNALTPRLAGPDRENTVLEAVAQMRRLDPKLGSDMITDVLIVADCPNFTARPDHGDAADRARIAAFRAQVDQLIGN